MYKNQCYFGVMGMVLVHFIEPIKNILTIVLLKWLLLVLHWKKGCTIILNASEMKIVQYKTSELHSVKVNNFMV